VRQTDALGNQGEASVAKTIKVDTTAPTAAVADPSIVDTATGETKATVTFSEEVDLLGASDVTVIGGGQLAALGADLVKGTYEFNIKPATALTSKEMGFSLAKGVTTDVAGNEFGGISQTVFAAVGTSGNDTLVTSAARDIVVTGGGVDTIKFPSAAHPVGAHPDLVFGFGADDKIDLSAILGSGGAGYTGSAIGDSGAGFMEMKNVKLTKGTSTTTVEFDITLDAATYQGSKITGITVDLKYTGSAVTLGTVTIPTYDFAGTAVPVWSLGQSNLKGASATGVITYAADPDPTLLAANPIIDANGKALSVKLTLNSLVDTFDLALEAQSAGGTTYITTADGKKHYVDVGIAKTAGKTAGADGVLEIFADGSKLGTVGDNQLRYSLVYDQATQTTRLGVQYDTNSKIGTTTLSDVMLVDFSGNLTSIFGTTNLVPL